MTYSATITSKRQLTLPSKLFEKMGFSTGERVVIEQVGQEIRLRSLSQLVVELAGSVQVPKKLRSVDIDDAITQAKHKHFSKSVK